MNPSLSDPLLQPLPQAGQAVVPLLHLDGGRGSEGEREIVDSALLTLWTYRSPPPLKLHFPRSKSLVYDSMIPFWKEERNIDISRKCF